MNNRFSKSLSPEQAYEKAKHFCAYQERSHFEIREKLYGFGLRKDDVEQLLSKLIEENYLNEERYARQFAGGKFRMKQWGKIKIAYELKQKRVSPFNINKALQEISQEDYLRTLRKLVLQKWKSLKNEQYINRQVKTKKYLLQKGFEPGLIQVEIAALKKDTKG